MIGVLRMPDDIRFGSQVRNGIPQAVTELGRRAFVVADPYLATTQPFHEVIAGLQAAGVEVSVYTEVPPELPVPAVEAAGRAAAAFAPEVILGYGGGSALDAAKLVGVLLAHGEPLNRFYGENAVPGPILPLVAVPTTAGTGSEATPVAVVSDPDRELKVGVSSAHLVPVLAFVDPDLTMEAPRTVTIFAGIDAFVHAVESYTAAALEIDLAGRLPVFVGRNVLTEPLSLEAAGLLYRALPAVVENPADRDARAAMAQGSLLAGIAFGATGTHLSHAIQYPVGAKTKTPHGLGTGALLPYVLQRVLPVIGDRLVDLGRAMGVLDGADPRWPEEQGQEVIDAVAGLCERIGLPVSLADLGLSEDDVDYIVDRTLEVGRLVNMSPLAADRALLTQIVSAAIAGDRTRLTSLAPTGTTSHD